jgi:hypothetical protein
MSTDDCEQINLSELIFGDHNDLTDDNKKADRAEIRSAFILTTMDQER